MAHDQILQEFVFLLLFMAHKVNCILLVDDNSIQNYLNIRLLNSLNIAQQIRVCLNGREALEFISDFYKENQKAPDLILLDLYMPEINGIDFLKAFNALPNVKKGSTKIIFFPLPQKLLILIV
ncbi:hypothetical protein BH23BAC1_BH23BAC1_22880 [soil metagenome]